MQKAASIAHLLGACDAWYWRGMFDLHSAAAVVARLRQSGRRDRVRRVARTGGCRPRRSFSAPRTERRTARSASIPGASATPSPAHGVFDFTSWDPEPAGSHPAGRSAWGVDDLVGNGWEWTSTVFAPFPGFRPLPSYPEYSADFFDGEHFVMKGASPATARELIRPTFRNWFRPRYPYVYATFRCVRTRSMTTRFRVSSPSFADDVRHYLQLTPRQLPSQYLYDPLGSALFDAICELPWYGITRAENRLLAGHREEIFAQLPGLTRIVELGPGDGRKLQTLVEGTSEPLTAHLIDVSAVALARAAHTLSDAPHVTVVTHEASFEDGLDAIARDLGAVARRAVGRTLVLFLGSNIGNFDPSGVAGAARAHSRAACAAATRSCIGADLVKPERDLLLAYDDPLGVSAAFNLNVLLRINRELGGNFDLAPSAIARSGIAACSRMEMYRRLQRGRSMCASRRSTWRSISRTARRSGPRAPTSTRREGLIGQLEAPGFEPVAQWIDREAGVRADASARDLGIGARCRRDSRAARPPRSSSPACPPQRCGRPVRRAPSAPADTAAASTRAPPARRRTAGSSAGCLRAETRSSPLINPAVASPAMRSTCPTPARDSSASDPSPAAARETSARRSSPDRGIHPAAPGTRSRIPPATPAPPAPHRRWCAGRRARASAPRTRIAKVLS